MAVYKDWPAVCFWECESQSDEVYSTWSDYCLLEHSRSVMYLSLSVWRGIFSTPLWWDPLILMMNVSCPDGPPDGWVYTSQHSQVTLSVTVHLCLFSPSVFLSYLVAFYFLDNSSYLRECWDLIQAFHPNKYTHTNTHTLQTGSVIIIFCQSAYLH